MKTRQTVQTTGQYSIKTIPPSHDSLEGYPTMGQGRLDRHIMNFFAQDENPAPIVETIKSIISLIATCIGLAIIIIGLKYATDIFQLIFSILQSPTVLTEPLRQMAESIGGSAFDLNLKDRSVPLANIMALAVYCGGALLSAWLTLALMHTGAKIVSLTAGDRSAVKKILQNAFGKNLQPKGTADSNETKSRNSF